MSSPKKATFIFLYCLLLNIITILKLFPYETTEYKIKTTFWGGFFININYKYNLKLTFVYIFDLFQMS